MNTPWEPIDFDSVWKESLDVFLKYFMQLFFPHAYEEIDWSKGYESLDKELNKIRPEAEVGKRFVDKLMKVYLRSGEETWVYIHIEIQSQPDATLPERMYIYNIRLFLLYKKPIMSLAVLGDDQDSWRPNCYEHDLWGSRISFTFPTVKLWDYRNRYEELKKSKNVFAYFVIAHLNTLKSRKNIQQRLNYKIEITQELLKLGLSEKDANYLFRFIDALMILPKNLEEEFLKFVHELKEETNMPFLAPFEQLAMEKGREEGLEKGIKTGSIQEAQTVVIEILEIKFNELPNTLIAKVRNIEDLDQLRNLRKEAFKVNSLEEFTKTLD